MGGEHGGRGGARSDLCTLMVVHMVGGAHSA